MIKYLHVIVVLCLCLFKGFIKLFCGIENPWHRSCMAITKNIVDMMGGTIKVQTAQGKGTEFIICLPMRTQAEHRPVEKITEPEDLKALVVEDNELNREIEPEILREYGFRVDTAEN